MPLTELFANIPSTTTTGSSGTTAPASGTTETWTVTSSASFAAATTFNATQFHVGDPFAPSEMIAVTNVSGTTWTVTRGAEGSTPVAHATAATFVQVTTAGFLASVVVLTALAQQALATQRAVALTPWYAGLANRQTARCNIACLGDSITEGQGATQPPGSAYDNRWIARLRDLLRARYPTPGMTGGGRGYMNIQSSGEVSFTWPTTITGTLPSVSTGPKSAGLQFNATGQNVTFPLVGDSADIMWEQVFSGGTFSWKVDSGGTTNVSTNGGSTIDGKLTRISLGTPGAHTVTLAWVSGSENVDGVIEYYGDSASGIQVHDCGHYGWQTSSWTSVLGAGGNATPAAAIAALNPSLVIITLGVNDQFSGVAPATFQSNLQSIITAIKASLTSPFPSFVLCMLPPRQNQNTYTFPWSQYVQAAYNVAAADTSGPSSASVVTVMDFTLGPRMPGADADVYSLWRAADLVHPDNKGHQYIADCFLQFLEQQ